MSVNMIVQDAAPRTKWIYWTASASALLAALMFAAGAIALLMPGSGSLLALLRGNWLITIFRLLAGDAGITAGDLYQLKALDLALLALVAATHAGLYCALHRSHRILAAVALVQPPLGILLLVLTHSIGRSAAMGAGLVISLAMLRGGPFGRWTGWMGLASSILLLAGDFGAGLAPFGPLAAVTAIGYVLLTAWLCAVAWQLFRLAR